MDVVEPLNATTDETKNTHQESEDVMEDRFACNICFESVTQPVVTRCGHLYCWPCLYVWLEPGMSSAERQYLDSTYNTHSFYSNGTVDAARRMCPVCKSPCSVKELVPIYVRECKSATVENRDEKKNERVVNGSFETLDDHLNNENNGDQEAAIDSELLEGNEDVDVNFVELDEGTERGDDINLSTEVTTGLRRRRPQQQHQEEQLTGTRTTQTSIDPVPARPPPPLSTIQPVTTTTTAHNIQSMTIRPPIELHQSLFQALMAVQNRPHNESSMMNSYQTSSSDRAIPSIHNRSANDNRNRSNNESSSSFEGDQRQQEQQQEQDAATEFLSRLLLMLGCFVILCLLLF